VVASVAVVAGVACVSFSLVGGYNFRLK